MQEIRDFLPHFHPNQIIFIPQKVRRIVHSNGDLLCDQDNFSKLKTLHKWDILCRKQSKAKRSTICYKYFPKNVLGYTRSIVQCVR